MIAESFIAIATEHGFTKDEALLYLSRKPAHVDLDEIDSEWIRNMVAKALPFIRAYRDEEGVNKVARNILAEEP